jgi:hypothetical protein
MTDLVHVCCECGRVERGGRWSPVPEVSASGAAATHGYCPWCADKLAKRAGLAPIYVQKYAAKLAAREISEIARIKT